MRDRMPRHLKLTNPFIGSGKGSSSEGSGDQGSTNDLAELQQFVPAKAITSNDDLPPHIASMLEQHEQKLGI